MRGSFRLCGRYRDRASLVCCGGEEVRTLSFVMRHLAGKEGLGGFRPDDKGRRRHKIPCGAYLRKERGSEGKTKKGESRE